MQIKCQGRGLFSEKVTLGANFYGSKSSLAGSLGKGAISKEFYNTKMMNSSMRELKEEFTFGIRQGKLNKLADI